MPYLWCPNCDGYYQLQPGESPTDFSLCQCGGELYYLEHLSADIELFEDDAGYDPEYTNKKSSRQKKLIFIMTPLLIFMVIGANLMAGFIPPLSALTGDQPDIIGSDSRGIVTKEVIGAGSRNLVVVTGIHPREKLSHQVVDQVIQDYALPPDTQIIHYNIKVLKDPDNYQKGRSNGEALASNYVLPDIMKSSADAVLITHDHVPGYGEGFYLATPYMDGGSVALAESIKGALPDFNYYKATEDSEHGTSTLTFSNPVASRGYRTLVYELPGQATYSEAYQETKKLIQQIFVFIS